MVCLIFLFGNSNAQDFNVVRGRVLLDSIPISGVHVQNLHTEQFTVTDDSGYFSIRVKIGNTLHLTHVGLETAYRTIVKEDFQFAGITIKMKEKINELEEVEVSRYTKITTKDIGIFEEIPEVKTYNEKALVSTNLFSGGGFNIIGLIDRITGKRKILKKNIANEQNLAIASYIREKMSPFLKKNLQLSAEEIEILVSYVMEEPKYHQAVRGNNLKEMELMLIESWNEYQQAIKEPF